MTPSASPAPAETTALPAEPLRFWAHASTAQLEGRRRCGLAARTVAVLPLAAVEQHGPHLPLGVDAMLAEAMVQAALPHLPAELPVLFLPTQAVGLSTEHLAYTGTLSLSPETALRVWTELGAAVQRAGVQRLVLFNTHGGNVGLMDVAARELRARLGLMVWHTSWFNLPLGEALAAFSAEEQRFGVHGGEIETSLMLAIAPQWVDMAQARHFRSQAEARAAAFPILGNGKSAKLAWQMQDYNPAGAAGRADAATAEKGRALLAAVGEQLAALLQEVAALPTETLQPPPHSVPKWP